jgi:dihydropteroate synthase
VNRTYIARRANGLARLWLRQGQEIVVHDLGEDELRRQFPDWRPPEPPRRFAGFALDRPLLMGVLNVTPDSFSDGGRYLVPDIAIEHGRALAAQGADIIDIGGESTRPGAAPVTVEEEIARVIPVVKALAADGLVLSIDTSKAAVMRAAVAAGARIINDITALTDDPESLAVAAACDASVVLMHIQGKPGTMQVAPRYDNALLDIYDWLEQRIEACRAAGIAAARLCVDPGIGFGKNVAHNCQILADLGLYHGLGVPLMLGVSRKSFIGALSRGEKPRHRLPGSLAAALAGVQRGAQILRVHDIAETGQAVAVWRAINQSE